MTMKRDAPWDRLDGFNLPIIRNFSTSTTPIRIAEGNPMRVLLIVAITPTGYIQYGPPPSVSIDPGLLPSGGMQVGYFTNPLIIQLADWGPAIASEWWAASTVAVNPGICVMEITAREWPGARDFKSLIRQADDGNFR